MRYVATSEKLISNNSLLQITILSGYRTICPQAYTTCSASHMFPTSNVISSKGVIRKTVVSPTNKISLLFINSITTSDINIVAPSSSSSHCCHHRHDHYQHISTHCQRYRRQRRHLLLCLIISPFYFTICHYIRNCTTYQRYCVTTYEVFVHSVIYFLLYDIICLFYVHAYFVDVLYSL